MGRHSTCHFHCCLRTPMLTQAFPAMQTVPPYWTPSPPIDSCGAGDAYAAGMLFGLLAGLDPAAMGSCGSRFASAVISKHGANLTQAEAAELLSGLPTPAATMCNLRMLLCGQPGLTQNVARVQ